MNRGNGDSFLLFDFSLNLGFLTCVWSMDGIFLLFCASFICEFPASNFSEGERIQFNAHISMDTSGVFVSSDSIRSYLLKFL